jgi:hypothetical protein
MQNNRPVATEDLSNCTTDSFQAGALPKLDSSESPLSKALDAHNQSKNPSTTIDE